MTVPISKSRHGRTNRSSGLHWARAAFFILGILTVCAPLRGATPEMLPEFPVVDSAILSRPETWRYVRVENFEVLSQASDAVTSELVKKLAVMPTVVRAILPGASSRVAPATLVILCDSAKSFDGFVPAGLRSQVDLTWVDRLFLASPRGPHDRVMVLHVTSREAFAHLTDDFLRDHVLASLRARDPATPGWFATGMAEIVADAVTTVKKDQLEIDYARLDPPRTDSVDTVKIADGALDPTQDFFTLLSTGIAGNATRPSLYDRVTVNPAAFEIIRGSYNDLTGDPQSSAHARTRLRFNDYFVERPHFPKFAAVLAHDEKLNPDDYRMMCWSFVYHCVFNPRGPKPELTRLLELSHAQPSADPVELFKTAFHLSPDAMELKLANEVGISSPGLTVTAAYRDPTFAIQDADVGLTARLKAEAFVAAEQPASAVRELEQARRYLGAGDSPEKLLERARVRLALALNQPEGAGGKISLHQTVEVLDLLFAARAKASAPLELYETAADTWIHSEAQPKLGHLGVLIEGANRFGADHPAYLYKVAALHLDHGFTVEAEALISAGVRFSRENDGERFRELRAKLKTL